MKHHDRTLRIIGGNWRGRKITFPQIDVIRPTSDRIRETLFNWLMHDIAGSRCLDLFAGSAALSFEALSRQAAHLTIVEQDDQVIQGIQKNLDSLEVPKARYDLHKAKAENWLPACQDQFDIIFLDPPFAKVNLPELCAQLARQGNATGLIYIESGAPLTSEDLPAHWQIHRQKRAGSVHYCLCDARG